MKIRFVSNAAAVQAQLRAARAGVLAAGGGVLLEGARGRCPVDTGELRASGSLSAGEDRAQVNFSAPHAVYVHERPGCKFLENAANDSALRSAMLQAMHRAAQF